MPKSFYKWVYSWAYCGFFGRQRQSNSVACVGQYEQPNKHRGVAGGSAGWPDGRTKSGCIGLYTVVAGSGFAGKFLQVSIFVGFLPLFLQVEVVFNSVACVGLVAGNMGYKTKVAGWHEAALDGQMATPKVVA